MKTLLLVLAVTLLSCSKDELKTTTKECNCIKEVYESVSYTYWSGGLPHLGVTNEFRYSEVIPCQTETSFVEIGNSMYYKIVCE